MDGKITYCKPNGSKRSFLRQDIYNFILKAAHYSKDDLIRQASEKRLKNTLNTLMEYYAEHIANIFDW